MKTPIRQIYNLPGRYIVSNAPYEIDWSDLMESGEAVISETVEVIQGDVELARVSTVNNITTFWLSEGSVGAQKLQVSVTTSNGETEAILISVPVMD